MLTIEEALKLVRDKLQSVNSPGTIRKKDTYIKRFRLMAEEKGFEFPCQEFYDMFMESAVKTGSQDIITNHCNLVRTMDEVSKTGAIDRHGKPYNETFHFPDKEETEEYFSRREFPIKDGAADISHLCTFATTILEGFSLSASTLFQYCLGFRRFIDFCAEKGHPDFLRCTAMEYLHELEEDFTDHGNWRYKLYRRSAMVLLEVADKGDFKWKMFRSPIETVPAGLSPLSDMVCQEMTSRNVSPATVSLYRYVFRLMVEATGAKEEEDIRKMSSDGVETILGAFSLRFSPKSLDTIHGIFRNILSILYKHSFLEADYSRMILPRNSLEDHMHTTLTKEETARVVEELDKVPLRDKAIILLALDLGLRDSDIRELTFENIDWQNDRIRIVQKKTGVPLELPLLDEVGNAIFDYITKERPQEAVCRQIFVRRQAPYSKLGSVYSIVSKVLKRLGLCEDKPKGPHVLRRTMVGRLLHAEVPHQVITDVLGHVSKDTDKEYYSMETERLRLCSLPLPGIAEEVQND